MSSSLEEKIAFDLSYGLPLESLVGMDEAGRGALMGPVVAACVVLPADFSLEGINDSKQIKNEQKRYILASKIKESCLGYGIGFVDNHTIEEIGIQQANFRAFQLALEDLKKSFDLTPSLILLDGNYSKVPIPTYESVKKGDGLSASIACASILAKTERDHYVNTVCHPEFPEFQFNKHKGYGTKHHQQMISEHGLTKWHRPYFCTRFISPTDNIKEVQNNNE